MIYVYIIYSDHTKECDWNYSSAAFCRCADSALFVGSSLVKAASVATHGWIVFRSKNMEWILVTVGEGVFFWKICVVFVVIFCLKGASLMVNLCYIHGGLVECFSWVNWINSCPKFGVNIWSSGAATRPGNAGQPSQAMGIISNQTPVRKKYVISIYIHGHLAIEFNIVIQIDG